MSSLFITAAASFVLTFLLTPLCRNLAVRWGALDHPDQNRKIHTRPIPRVGGVPIFVAYAGSLAILVWSSGHGGGLIRDHLHFVWRFLPAVALVFATGLLDDLRGLKPWQKLAGELAASGMAIWAGVQINSVAGRNIPAWCAIPVTVLWLVGCTNAFNLIDGVDGLAAGVGLFATVTTMLGALLQHNLALAIATVPLAGALAGFLRFNFNPASIFLGDSGSLSTGFLLGCYGVLWSHKSTTILGMTAPLMALSVPILDTCLAIIRRFLRHKPIFGADMGHIHHKLLARGLRPRRVVVLMYMICGLCAALSLLQSLAHERYAGAIIVLFSVGVLFGVQRLGYAEFEAARRIVFGANFRRLLNAELLLGTFHDELAAAATPDECWAVLQRNYSEFGFYEIRFKVGDRIYRDTTNGHGVPRSWTLRIQLSEIDYLNLSREFATQAPPIVARFSDVIGQVLTAKASAMRLLTYGEQAADKHKSERKEEKACSAAA
jgi:UDP-GlcNAc:undecaprenyl-phosphate GlcNAc-1-phosphate transferase